MVHLFGEFRARFGELAPVAPSPPGWAPRLPASDDPPELIVVGDPAAIPIDHGLRGLSLILDYVDMANVQTTRKVSCSRLVREHGELYLRAFCHHRRAPRKFRVDRISGVYDVVTGENMGTGDDWFAANITDRTLVAAGEWGLLPRQREALGAGMIVLTFLSRCDGECHPAEVEEVEGFARGWWIRNEITAEFPEAAIADRARRLAPDVEAFEHAAHLARGDRVLRPLSAGYARRLIEADGRIAQAEHDWITRLISWWEAA